MLATMAMFLLFLQESSIHGLRYLVDSKRFVAKILWLACIASSFTAAGFVTYWNFVNWNDSPAVVTSVESSLVKVGIVTA